MYVKFWGTRGSIASPGHRTARFGGNTSCVEVRDGNGTLIVLDCGTGARELGLELARSAPRALHVHLFIGHTHWDHIQGFPFFAPAFLPGAELTIYAPLGFQKSLEDAMSGQMEYAYFPVKLRDLPSRISFTELDEGFFRVGDVLVETQYLNHPVPTIAYRMTSGNTTVAYVTDHEPFWTPGGGRFDHPGDQRHVEFLRDTDLLIHDAQYTQEEYAARIGWGHSSIEYAIDVAVEAGVRRLALFHHDPAHDDQVMAELEATARTRAIDRAVGLDVFAAVEGLTVDVKGRSTSTRVTASSAIRPHPVAGRRVAVVSGDAAEVNWIEREVAEDNLTVLTMPDARTALDRLGRAAPDIVVVSNRLPDADGASLIGPIRAAVGRDDVPVLLLTDARGPGTVSPLGAPAPTDYLARPFTAPMLRARLRAWLSRALRASASELAVEGPEIGIAGADAVSRYADLLATTPLFRPLRRDQLEAVAAQAIDHAYPEGYVIVREGAPAHSLFVIVAGRVRVTETSHDTQAELLLSELGPGQIFGELGVLGNKPRTANVIAIDRVRCLVLPAQHFLAAVKSSPDLSLGLLQVLAGRIANADRRVARYAPDALTGLVGRRAFEEQYRRLAAGVRRRGTGALLVTLDVPQLRNVNDRFGYEIGDETLKAVGEALREATRTIDVVSRYGADEFAVLLADLESKDVDGVVARIQRKLHDVGVRRGLPQELTCALGAAFGAPPPDDPEDLLREADADMTRRRQQG